MCTSPQLFAAYHVFLRLLVPRHPPCALGCLTISLRLILVNLPPASSVMLLGLPDSFHQDFCVFVFVIVGSLSAFACRFMQIY